MSSITAVEFKIKNGKNLTLRTALVKDAPQIVKLMRDIVKEGPYTLAEPDEYKSTVKSESAKIKRFLKAEGKIYLVAEVKNEICGFISFDNWDTRRTAHTGLFSVFIKKKCEKWELGKFLLRECLTGRKIIL